MGILSVFARMVLDVFEFEDPRDKLAAFLTLAFFVGVPILLILLFIAPFFYLWLKKKKFTFWNIVLSLFAGIVLVALGIYGAIFFIEYLQGAAFNALYGY
ncbi:MAG: hypothetical protein WD200_03230 [Candidatus Andersenbacteria bacterium]